MALNCLKKELQNLCFAAKDHQLQSILHFTVIV